MNQANGKAAMADKILVFISMLALTVFIGVVVAYVAEPELVIVTVLVLALAGHDFWISVFRRQEEPGMVPGGSLESRPTGVSGKPAPQKNAPARKKSAKHASTKK